MCGGCAFSGNGDLTYEEAKSHYTAWALMKSPLLIGTDVRSPRFFLDVCRVSLTVAVASSSSSIAAAIAAGRARSSRASRPRRSRSSRTARSSRSTRTPLSARASRPSAGAATCVPPFLSPHATSERLAGWLAGWLTYWLTYVLAGWLIGWVRARAARLDERLYVPGAVLERALAERDRVHARA